MIPWLLDPDPFETAMREYLSEKPRIPGPFFPPGRLKEHEFSSPAVDAALSDEDEYFFHSPSVHFEFCWVVDSLVHQAFLTRKAKSRSDNVQLFRAFIGPFLICAPHRPWNEYGGDIGTALSPQSLRGVNRYRALCDFDSLQTNFHSLGGREPWKNRDFKHFVEFADFRSYSDRLAALVNEGIETDRALLIGVY
jgi:hypothetical protein